MAPPPEHLGELAGIVGKRSMDRLRIDGWGTPVKYRAMDQIVVFESAGDDHAFGSGDDLIVTDTVGRITPPR